MDLLDRYLQAVKKHLPWQRQDDIIAELRANLEAQLEDKEAGLGRPLTTGEAEDWLRQIGPPKQMAARYQPQRYLIGPTIFPTYWFVLRIACFWATIGYLIASVARIATHAPIGAIVLEAVLSVPGVLLTTAAWVTLIFAAIEFAATHYPAKWPAFAGTSANWSLDALPLIEKETAPGKKQHGLAHAVAEVIFGFIVLVWLLLIPQHPFLLLGPGALYLQHSPFLYAPVWVQVYWWVIALNLIQLAWHSLDLWSGRWQQPRHAQRVVMCVLGLIPLGLLLSTGDHVYITLKDSALDPLRYGEALGSINNAIHLSVLLLCAITVLQLLCSIWRICRDFYRKRAAAM